ncbi:cupin domain-containing protein (plasmid) [Halorarum halophilum]|uniref:Cupin domain-containing protein n=1 Tax=Halorarum halophilum TaxID=2743090 RepID=A0A7D5KPX8_9EURY|nr:cupin domain-containing protein [Halobaculum halophilum]QLG29942.1 cupin domain-containing protein [Halobaculum halophilum]
MERTSISEQETIEPEEGVRVTQLVAGENMNAQHFRFDPGATAMEHSHPHEQIVYILEGTFTVILDGEPFEFEAGDSYVIPGDVPHASENNTDEPVSGIDVFSPARDGTPWD